MRDGLVCYVSANDDVSNVEIQLWRTVRAGGRGNENRSRNSIFFRSTVALIDDVHHLNGWRRRRRVGEREKKKLEFVLDSFSSGQSKNYFSQFTDDAVAIIMQSFGCIIIAFPCSCGEGGIKWTLKASNQRVFLFYGDELKSFEMWTQKVFSLK